MYKSKEKFLRDLLSISFIVNFQLQTVYIFAATKLDNVLCIFIFITLALRLFFMKSCFDFTL